MSCFSQFSTAETGGVGDGNAVIDPTETKKNGLFWFMRIGEEDFTGDHKAAAFIVLQAWVWQLKTKVEAAVRVQ